MKIFVNMRLNNINEEAFLKNIPVVYHLLNYYIIELFLFEIQRNNNLTYFSPKIISYIRSVFSLLHIKKFPSVLIYILFLKNKY